MRRCSTAGLLVHRQRPRASPRPGGVPWTHRTPLRARGGRRGPANAGCATEVLAPPSPPSWGARCVGAPRRVRRCTGAPPEPPHGLGASRDASHTSQNSGGEPGARDRRMCDRGAPAPDLVEGGVFYVAGRPGREATRRGGGGGAHPPLPVVQCCPPRTHGRLATSRQAPHSHDDLRRRRQDPSTHHSHTHPTFKKSKLDRTRAGGVRGLLGRSKNGTASTGARVPDENACTCSLQLSPHSQVPATHTHVVQSEVEIG